LKAERNYTTRSNRLAVSSLAGINLEGKRVLDELQTKANRWVIVRLQMTTLDDDVAYWTAVKASLPAGYIEVVGYCDTSECVKSLSEPGRRPAFEVLVYGEVISSQAVASADAAGAYVLLEKDFRFIRRAGWRVPGRPPSVTSSEVVQ
jgi:hypothetical protein